MRKYLLAVLAVSILILSGVARASDDLGGISSQPQEPPSSEDNNGEPSGETSSAADVDTSDEETSQEDSVGHEDELLKAKEKILEERVQNQHGQGSNAERAHARRN